MKKKNKKQTFSNKNHIKTQSHTGNIPSRNNEVIKPKFIYFSYTTGKLKKIYEWKEESREKGQTIFFFNKIQDTLMGKGKWIKLTNLEIKGKFPKSMKDIYRKPRANTMCHSKRLNAFFLWSGSRR